MNHSGSKIIFLYYCIKLSAEDKSILIALNSDKEINGDAKTPIKITAVTVKPRTIFKVLEGEITGS